MCRKVTLSSFGIATHISALASSAIESVIHSRFPNFYYCVELLFIFFSLVASTFRDVSFLSPWHALPALESCAVFLGRLGSRLKHPLPLFTVL